MEQIWVNALNEQPPRTVSVKITPVYPTESFRPDYIEVMYKIEGKETEIRINKRTTRHSCELTRRNCF